MLKQVVNAAGGAAALRAFPLQRMGFGLFTRESPHPDTRERPAQDKVKPAYFAEGERDDYSGFQSIRGGDRENRKAEDISPRRQDATQR
jgi:hypothetical protein